MDIGSIAGVGVASGTGASAEVVAVGLRSSDMMFKQFPMRFQRPEPQPQPDNPDREIRLAESEYISDTPRTIHHEWLQKEVNSSCYFLADTLRFFDIVNSTCWFEYDTAIRFHHHHSRRNCSKFLQTRHDMLGRSLQQNLPMKPHYRWLLMQNAVCLLI